MSFKFPMGVGTRYSDAFFRVGVADKGTAVSVVEFNSKILKGIMSAGSTVQLKVLHDRVGQ